VVDGRTEREREGERERERERGREREGERERGGRSSGTGNEGEAREPVNRERHSSPHIHPSVQSLILLLLFLLLLLLLLSLQSLPLASARLSSIIPPPTPLLTYYSRRPILSLRHSSFPLHSVLATVCSLHLPPLPPPLPLIRQTTLIMLSSLSSRTAATLLLAGSLVSAIALDLTSQGRSPHPAIPPPPPPYQWASY
jgi:hypothetical protein